MLYRACLGLTGKGKSVQACKRRIMSPRSLWTVEPAPPQSAPGGAELGHTRSGRGSDGSFVIVQRRLTVSQIQGSRTGASGRHRHSGIR